MLEKYKRAYALIDLDKAIYNIKLIREHIGDKKLLSAVIKADAYGHGSIPVAKALNEYVDCFCVATASEAMNLRYHNIKKDILILGPIADFDYSDIIEYDIYPTVFTIEQAKSLSEQAVKKNKRVRIHIALDTGMNRIGIKAKEENIALVIEISRLKNIEVYGIFTHFYSADYDIEKSKLQLQSYKLFVDKLKENGIEPKIKHISNSAAIVENTGLDFDMVRAGIIIYGINPLVDKMVENFDFKPIMSIKSTITYTKYIKEGEIVSYGEAFKATKPVRVATIPIGYADGYPRVLGNVGYVLIHGKRANILGRICMDQMMVDITDIEDVNIGDEVTLVGEDLEENITIEELSEISTRFSYEFICNISKRIPRIYILNNQIVGKKDYQIDIFEDFL